MNDTAFKQLCDLMGQAQTFKFLSEFAHDLPLRFQSDVPSVLITRRDHDDFVLPDYLGSAS